MKHIVLVLALGLAACNEPAVRTSSPEETAKLNSGQVALVATAPDGTKLWAVRKGSLNGRVVYFASTGDTSTSHGESCGKNCNRTVPDEVPFAQ